MEEYRKYNKSIEVSNLGNVKIDGSIVIPCRDKYYLYVVYKTQPIRIHTMVGKMFPEICGEHILWGHYHHLNGNQLDNRAENIRCISNSEHRKIHQKEDGVSIAVVAYNKAGEFVGRWDSMWQAATETGADFRHISEIINGEKRRFSTKGLYWFKDERKNEDYSKKVLELQSIKYQTLRGNSNAKKDKK